MSLLQEVILMSNQKSNLYSILDELIMRYPILNVIKEDIFNAYLLLEKCFENKNKLLIAGNGGSAADAEHIVGELMKGFKKERKIPIDFAAKLIDLDNTRGENIARKIQGALPTIALNNHSDLNSAFLNDVDGLLCYAQQVYGYGNSGDTLLAISTSGNSENIIDSVIVAKAKAMKVISLTGRSGGMLNKISDVSIVVQEDETYKIQELHLPIYHTLCLMLETNFFK